MIVNFGKLFITDVAQMLGFFFYGLGYDKNWLGHV
jgi:hypothetical protein